MDPLSVIASCIAVAGAAKTAVRGVSKLKGLRNLPDILLAVVNEVADLALVVQEIKLSFQQFQHTSSVPANIFSTINQRLDRAQATLLELDQVVNYSLLLPPKDNGDIVVSHSAWIRKEGHVHRLQERLRTIRLDITTTFAALNFTRTIQLDVRIQELSLMTETIRNSQHSDSSQQDISEQLLAHFRHLQELQHHNNRTLRSLSNDFIALRESMTLASMSGTKSQHEFQSVRSPTSSLTAKLDDLSGIVSVKVQQVLVSPCLRRCLCKCHTRRQWRTPQLFDWLIGRLFLGYSSTPNAAPSCNLDSCGRYRHNLITVIYAFPQWFLWQTVSIIMLHTKRDGPVLSLRTLRARDPSSAIFFHVERGDIAMVKSLFERGEASPFDINAQISESLIQIATENMQSSMCRYLLDEGADPYLQIGTNPSPSTQVWNKIFGNEGDALVIAILRQMFCDDDDLDAWRLTTLHRIILCLDSKDLSTYLQICSRSELNRRDANGWTGLQWAARRGDIETVRSLLAAGTDPNILNNAGSSALYYAAKRGDINIVDYLLTHGAKINPRNNYQCTPLNYMFTEPSVRPPDLTCLERLITAGAEIDAQDYQGATPVMYAAQYGLTAVMKLLLEKNANTNKQTFSGETALMIAVQVNADNPLHVLLTHGADLMLYSNDGRSILHYAAEHGDLRTLQILTSARIRGLQIDRKNIDGKTPLQLAQERVDETPEWHTAFADLLSSVDERPSESPSNTVSEGSTALAPAVLSRVMDRLYEEAQQIYEYLGRIPRPPLAVLRALVALWVAIAWITLYR